MEHPAQHEIDTEIARHEEQLKTYKEYVGKISIWLITALMAWVGYQTLASSSNISSLKEKITIMEQSIQDYKLQHTETNQRLRTLERQVAVLESKK